MFAASISEAISAEQTSATGLALPPVDHELVWDPGLSAAAGFVVASILEWPTLPPAEAIAATLQNIAGFYRVKLAARKSSSARSVITATENAITALLGGKAVRTNTGKAIIAAYNTGIQLTGRPVTDWQLARARLHGTAELEEVFSKARLLRLLHATDALAWGLADIWDGQAAYPAAAATVRRIIADEMIDGRPAEPHPVTLMNMHKPKGKEFDAVIIVEGLHRDRLLDQTWDAKRTLRNRRVLRVAITPRPPRCLPRASSGRHPARPSGPPGDCQRKRIVNRSRSASAGAALPAERDDLRAGKDAAGAGLGKLMVVSLPADSASGVTDGPFVTVWS